jgi:hypothetical protein
MFDNNDDVGNVESKESDEIVVVVVDEFSPTPNEAPISRRHCS